MSRPAPEVGPVGPWPVRVVAVTGSTNADLADLARRGRRDPQVLVARSQTAGRGRLGRVWASPPGASVSLSLLWAPAVTPSAWPWLPLVVGLGVVDAAASLGVRAGLKWPNDVVVAAPAPTSGSGPVETDRGVGDPGVGPVVGPLVPPVAGSLTGLTKLAGILCEVVGTPDGAVLVAGVGLNLLPPGPGAGGRAASLAGLLGGRAPSFESTTAALAAAVEQRLLAWQDARGDVDAAGLRRDYLSRCTTLGRQVRISTPAGPQHGRALDVAADGALVLRGEAGDVRVQAGDVEHVR